MPQSYRDHRRNLPVKRGYEVLPNVRYDIAYVANSRALIYEIQISSHKLPYRSFRISNVRTRDSISSTRYTTQDVLVTFRMRCTYCSSLAGEPVYKIGQPCFDIFKSLREVPYLDGVVGFQYADSTTGTVRTISRRSEHFCWENFGILRSMTALYDEPPPLIWDRPLIWALPSYSMEFGTTFPPPAYANDLTDPEPELEPANRENEKATRSEGTQTTITWLMKRPERATEEHESRWETIRKKIGYYLPRYYTQGGSGLGGKGLLLAFVVGLIALCYAQSVGNLTTGSVRGPFTTAMGFTEETPCFSLEAYWACE